MGLVALAVSPASASGIVVKRVTGPSAGAARAGVASLAQRPDIARQITARTEAWNRVPEFVSHPKVDWSPRAARRAGWRAPATPLSRTHRGERGDGARDGRQGALATADTLKVAIIRIDFAADRGGSESTGNGRFDLSNPGTSAPPIDRPPHNKSYYEDHLTALSRYYDTQSYGRVIVAGDVWPRDENTAYTMTDMADHGPWKFSPDIYIPAIALFRGMFFTADTQSVRLGDRIPWDQYDRYIFIHAGSDLQSDVRQDSKEDIPSFTIGVGDSDVVIFSDSTAWNRANPIDRACIIPETINQDDYFGAINGVLAHECGHLFFGFADLYNTENGFPVVGLWSLMDSGNLVGSLVVLPDQTEIFATGLLPPSVDPWQRSFIPTPPLPLPEVAYGDTFALRSSQRHPDIFRVSLTTDEYLLLENRYLAPADSVELDQADTSRVVLGPLKPDRHEYDALLPGGGILVWHIDESVIPSTEWVSPCDSTRANERCGFNSNPRRLAIGVIEADGLADLGDPNSPFILGSPSDPWPQPLSHALGDSTVPNLIPHIGTLPHIRIDFLDDIDSTMRIAAFRTWQLKGWPLRASMPPDGPLPLAIDVDGDKIDDLVWAGGPAGSPDSARVFALRGTGTGVIGLSPILSSALDCRPNPLIAAIPRGDELTPLPAMIAVTTLPKGPDTSAVGGRVWVLDGQGVPIPGWPARLPSIVTTPPVFVGVPGDTFVYVGCADGFVYALRVDGSVAAISGTALAGGVRGRLALYPRPLQAGIVGGSFLAVAAGGGSGQVGTFAHILGPVPSSVTTGGPPPAIATMNAVGPRWPIQVGSTGFVPDFLWLDFGGARDTGAGPVVSTDDAACYNGALSLVVHHADRLWAFCLSGFAVSGWGQSVGDTLNPGLAAGDVDGDGFPEVVAQSISSRVFYLSVDGHSTPGWPKRGSLERFRTGAPPLAARLDDDAATEVIALNASGVVEAFDARGHEPEGWPLGTGLFASGAPVLADLNGDHFLELVAPDATGIWYAYTLPTRDSALLGVSWPMVGGDPGRSSALPLERTPSGEPASAGPLVDGSLKAYPNPARRKPVRFAYRLTEPGQVEFRIMDSSGHQVASFTRPARQADNVETWDPGSLPAGLYVARLKFRGATSERVETLPVGLLR